MLKYIHKEIKQKKKAKKAMRTDTTTTPGVEPVTMSEVLEIASWDRPRTDEELQSFRDRHESTVGTIDLSEFGLAA